VRARLTDLRRIEKVLVELVTQCAAAPDHVRCPLIASLQQDPRKTSQ
jgi:MerR family mercuric resistance operon transcriptional regulator